MATGASVAPAACCDHCAVCHRQSRGAAVWCEHQCGTGPWPEKYGGWDLAHADILNPLAAVAPGAYVIWQNMVNAWQLWYKGKYGKLKY